MVAPRLQGRGKTVWWITKGPNANVPKVEAQVAPSNGEFMEQKISAA